MNEDYCPDRVLPTESNTIETIPFNFASPTGTVFLVPDISYGGLIRSFTIETTTGNGTITLSVNGDAVTGVSVVTATTSRTVYIPTALNTFAAGDDLKLTIVSGSLTGVSGSLSLLRSSDTSTACPCNEPEVEAYSPDDLMENDVNGNGQSFYNVGGFNIGYKSTREIWIGKRTTQFGDSQPKSGSGSEDDPFDGSSQTRLDALFALYAPQGKIIRIHDEAYTASFNYTFAANSNIIGAGKNNVLITNSGFTAGNCITGIGDNILFEGFTVDVNGSTLGSVTTGGVGIKAGNNARIRNVGVLHPACYGAECFPLSIFASGASITGALLEDCSVQNALGPNGTMIFLGIDPTNVNAVITGRAQFNDVTNCPGVIAYGSAGALDLKFIENYAETCNMGFNRDSFLSTRHVLDGNTFINCKQYGISIRAAAGAFSDANALDDRVVNNTVTMIPYPTYGQDQISYWIRSETAAEPGHSRVLLDGLELANNKALNYGPDTPNMAIGQTGFLIDINSNLIAKNNVSSVILKHSFSQFTGTMQLWDNLNVDGTPMYANDGSIMPRTLVPFNKCAQDMPTNEEALLLDSNDLQVVLGDVQFTGDSIFLDEGNTYLRRAQSTNDVGLSVTFLGGASKTTERGRIGFAHTGSGGVTFFTDEKANGFYLRSETEVGFGVGGSNVAFAIRAGGGLWGRKLAADITNAEAAGGGSLFYRDSGGKTQLCVRFPTGAAVPIAIEP